MTNSIARPPLPINEPILSFAPGSAARASLEAEVARQHGEVVEIPCVVGGRRVFTGNTVPVTMPCDHGHVLARVHLATPALVEEAIGAALSARRAWAAMPYEERATVLLRAAEKLAGPWRDRLNASTMLGQAKTCNQAEIDAACELIDFFRFNVSYARQLYAEQPSSNPGMWNRLDYRGLEGFVFAITPFNFTSIALNLASAPALMGNTVLWKPSLTQSLSAWYGMQLLEESGMPAGVINLLHGHGADVGDPVLASPHLAGLHFTGSTPTFQHLWRSIGENISNYRTYPRIVGETGGKDFIVAHASADVDELAVAVLRGAFEFQGQKCSAASRIYVPDSLWPAVRERVVAGLGQMKMGDTRDFSNFIGAVIDERAYEKHVGYQALARETGKIVAGGGADRSVGWFVEPTLVEVAEPDHRLMSEEIFGPIATVYVYKESSYSELLKQVDATSPYALTGAVFARDRSAVLEASVALREAAGNFYVNDKPTGAVVGQQPFGGARGSGTNDKAGSVLNLMRWCSPRTIKETLSPPKTWGYPFLG
ncbi:MAG: 1-pyrroline-5-carboxylate dehydrogenase [Myxococcota bacterium]|jgi:1-pyrroline-5-carboxylate dehydrogenase